jgi:Pectate lyase superfamily protein
MRILRILIAVSALVFFHVTRCRAGSTRNKSTAGIQMIGVNRTGADINSNFNVKQVYNVKAYGAVGNCSTDDAPAIQKAINAALLGGCAPVYFPPLGQSKCYSTREPIVEQLPVGARCSPYAFNRLSKLFGSATTPTEIHPAANVPGIVVLLSGYGTNGNTWIKWLDTPLVTGSGYSYTTGPAGAPQYSWLNLDDVLHPTGSAGPLNGLTAFDVRFFFSARANEVNGNNHSFLASYGSTTGAPGYTIPASPTQADLTFQVANAGNAIQGQLVAKLNVAGTIKSINSGGTVYPRDGSVHEAELSYDGTTMRLFLDGTIVGSTRASGTVRQSLHQDMFIGTAPSEWPDLNGTDVVNGANIDSVELSKVARHTSNYTHDTAKFPGDSNTLALVNFDRFYGINGASTTQQPLVMPDNLLGTYNPNAYMIFRDHSDSAVGGTFDIEELSIIGGNFGLFAADGISPYIHKFDFEDQTAWGVETFFNIFEGVYDEGFIQANYGMNLGAGGMVKNLRVTGGYYGLVNPSEADYYTHTASVVGVTGMYLVGNGTIATGCNFCEFDDENGGSATNVTTNGPVTFTMNGGVLQTPSTASPIQVEGNAGSAGTDILLSNVLSQPASGTTSLIADNGSSVLYVQAVGGTTSSATALVVPKADTAAVLTQNGPNPFLMTYANLGSLANGSFVYCSDCTMSDPCAGRGTGAFAKRLNGAWVCN